MFGELIASWQVTPPAIWGKLSGHADFVRFGTGQGEIEAWRAWLAQEARRCTLSVGDKAGQSLSGAERRPGLPVAFVLPPGTLPFARRQCVLGVIATSGDSLGHRHPLVVYQAARPSWIRRHFENHAAQPRDWQFWLARMLGRHLAAASPANIRTLAIAVRALWDEQSRAGGTPGLPPGPAFANASGRDDPSGHRMQAVIDRWTAPRPAIDPVAHVRGVRFLPWSDWPDRTWSAHAGSAFWQQDAEGRFVDASHRLQATWGVLP